jgi:hypothetical protein
VEIEPSTARPGPVGRMIAKRGLWVSFAVGIGPNYVGVRETALAADSMPCRACVAGIERQLVPVADLMVRMSCPKRHLREWRKVSLDDPGERSSVQTRGVADQSR